MLLPLSNCNIDMLRSKPVLISVIKFRSHVCNGQMHYYSRKDLELMANRAEIALFLKRLD